MDKQPVYRQPQLDNTVTTERGRQPYRIYAGSRVRLATDDDGVAFVYSPINNVVILLENVQMKYHHTIASVRIADCIAVLT